MTRPTVSSTTSQAVSSAALQAVSAATWRAWALGALALLACAAAPGVARAGWRAEAAGAAFAVLAPEFVRAARPVEGLVVAVEGLRVYLDLGAASGLAAGQELALVRPGAPLRHPITGVELGRSEVALGRVRVERVADAHAEGALAAAPGVPTPVPGDTARLSRGRVRVAVAPALDLSGGGGDWRRLPYMVASQLMLTGRFEPVEQAVVLARLPGGSARVDDLLARPEAAVAAAAGLDIAGWIVPVIVERRGVTYLDVTWISAATGTPLLTRRRALAGMAGGGGPRFPWEPARGR